MDYVLGQLARMVQIVKLTQIFGPIRDLSDKRRMRPQELKRMGMGKGK